MKEHALVNRVSGFARSLVHPDAVKTNGDTSLLRLIAMITMVIDHFGKMRFPQIPEMRLIGALPSRSSRSSLQRDVGTRGTSGSDSCWFSCWA